MYRCPRCNVELSPDARYCPRCGFNQTNARMQKVAPQQAARNNTPAPPTPVIPVKSMKPGVQPVLPPPPPTPAPSSRPAQPSVQPSITPGPVPEGLVGSPLPPPSPSLGIHKQMSPTLAENIQQLEDKEVAPANSLQPVKTNTPPIPGKMTPPPPSRQGLTNQAASSADQGHPQAKEDTSGDKEQSAGEEAKAPSFPLKKRYIAEQETRHQVAFPTNNTPGIPLDMSPARPLQNTPGIPTDMSPVRPMPNEATPQRPDLQRGGGIAPTMPPPPVVPPADPFTGEGAESLIATSKAAEHWRQSWRDRQHDEAGPAVGITRGQADVPEPLMAMQQSIARMRAIILPKNTGNTPSKNFGFWVTLILLLCIIGGLCAYIISTYTPSAQLAAQISGAGSASPTLAIKGKQTGPIKAGQTLNVHGTYFGPNHAITFILDTTALSTSPVQSNDKGTFDASLVIPATWLTGNYALQAQDNKSGLHAFLDIQILPTTQTMSNNTPLVLTTNDLPLPTTGLKFQAVAGKNSLTSQRITLTNSGNTPVQWSASALANNNLNWLIINDGKTNGTLDIQGTDSIGISVNSIGLTSSTKPYLGSLILTIDKTQAIIPITLTVQSTTLEVVVSPNPVIAHLQGGGTCQPVTLTLINLSSQVVTWNANPYDVDKPHIHLDNQTTDQGTLDPEGLPNDTKAIQITCISAQIGEKLYHISVYYNGIAVNVPVSVRGA